MTRVDVARRIAHESTAASAAARDVDADALVERLNRWALDGLPRANRAILTGRQSSAALVAEMRERVLAPLPPPEAFTAAQAQRLVVILGLAGASVARHYQEADVARKAEPQRSFDALAVGPDATAFLPYFARLAEVTRTGHCARDCFASLVRWNAPTTEVALGSTTLATLPGCFADQAIRTYTAEAGEIGFFELLKKSEALEAAINAALWPLAEGQIELLGPEATAHAALAATLLKALIRLNAQFAARPPERGGLRTEHFMDVFRQFAVHWQSGDIPPSGAQDAEFLMRDLLLGIDLPDYRTHVRRVFPAMLESERRRLETQAQRDPLPSLLLRGLELDRGALAAMTTQRLAALVADRPALAVWHRLLAANARLSAVHLKLAERFMFGPQRIRDQGGIGDRALVSNRRGTTGMDQTLLVRLAEARRRHILTALDRLPLRDLNALADSITRAQSADTHDELTVRFTTIQSTR